MLNFDNFQQKNILFILIIFSSVFAMERPHQEYNQEATQRLQRMLQEDQHISPTLIKACVDSDADPNISRADGATPLFIAVWMKNLDLIRHLLLKGASANNVRAGGVTVLMDAVACPPNPMPLGNMLEVVECLLDAGADVLKQNENGCTVLHAAINTRSLKLIRLLAKHKSSAGNLLITQKNARGRLPQDMVPDDKSNCSRKIVRFLKQGGKEKIK
jgi:hypothetical protein